MELRLLKVPLDVIPLKVSGKNIHDNDSEWGESYFWYWKGFKCRWRLIGAENHNPIVLVHGFGASSCHWRNNVNAFVDAGYRVYGIDLIGFGESDQPAPNSKRKLDNYFWSNQLTAFLEQIVDTKRLGKAVLLGNSLGSLVALTTVVYRPDLISALIAAPLPDPAFTQISPLVELGFLRRVKDFFVNVLCWILPLDLLVPLISRTKLIKWALQAAYYRSVQFDHDLQRLVTLPARRPTAARSLRAMCIGMASRPIPITGPALLSRMSKSVDRVPMLVLWGLKDQLVPFSLGKRIIKFHPWINLIAIAETGHCPHDESPQEFNDCVMNWLNLNLNSDR